MFVCAFSVGILVAPDACHPTTYSARDASGADCPSIATPLSQQHQRSSHKVNCESRVWAAHRYLAAFASGTKSRQIRESVRSQHRGDEPGGLAGPYRGGVQASPLQPAATRYGTRQLLSRAPRIEFRDLSLWRAISQIGSRRARSRPGMGNGRSLALI